MGAYHIGSAGPANQYKAGSDPIGAARMDFGLEVDRGGPGVSETRPTKRSSERTVAPRIALAATAVKAAQKSTGTAPPVSEGLEAQQIERIGMYVPKNGLNQRKRTSSGPARMVEIMIAG